MFQVNYSIIIFNRKLFIISFLCISPQFVSSKDVFNLQQFSNDSPSTTLLISRSSPQNLDESRLETHFRNAFIQRNLHYNFVFQFEVMSNTRITPASKLNSKNVAILLALNSEATSFVGVALNRIKNEPSFTNSVAIICVLNNDYNVLTITSSLNPWKSRTLTAFLYEITQSLVSETGTYFYLCLLCDVSQARIKVDRPTQSLNDLNFQEKWGNFEILSFSRGVEWDTRTLKYYCTGRHRTLRSMQCRFQLRLSALLQSKLNVTTGFVSDSRIIFNNPHGGMVFLLSVANVDGLANMIIRYERSGYHLVYCDYSKGSLSSSSLFSKVWIQPYSSEVWCCIGLLIICLIALQYKMAISTKLVNIVGLFLRQRVTSNRALHITALFASPLLLIYENYTVSKLIVPPVENQLRSLKAVVDAGYEIWVNSPFPGMIPLKNSTVSELAQLGYDEEKLSNNSIFEVNSTDLFFLFEVMNYSTIKRSILFSSASIPLSFDSIQNQLLGGKYSCYKIENAAIVKNYYDLAFFRFSNHLKKFVSYLYAGGISNFWKDLLDFSFELGISREGRRRSSRTGKRIKMINLTSIIFWCSLLLGVAGVVFIIEQLCHRFKIKEGILYQKCMYALRSTYS